MHSQSPVLETKGVLSNPVILRYLQTKLHPPYPNKTACSVYEFRSQKCPQFLKNVGLYNSFGVANFSFRQSRLTQASRYANSQASALNAAPNMPESNCLYCQGVVLHVSLLHSYQVDWFRHDRCMNCNFECNFYVKNALNTSKPKTHPKSSNFKSQLRK